MYVQASIGSPPITCMSRSRAGGRACRPACLPSLPSSLMAIVTSSDWRMILFRSSMGRMESVPRSGGAFSRAVLESAITRGFKSSIGRILSVPRSSNSCSGIWLDSDITR